VFPTRYFADRYYAPRYFPKVGEDAPVGGATRRGPSARGRARTRGARLWWVIAVLTGLS
jgi:hypothetical protein